MTTRAELVSDTLFWMDAEDTDRFPTDKVLTALDAVYDGEWSNLLSVAPYYRVVTNTVTTDANGRANLSALVASVSGARLYRVISVTDGDNVVYNEIRFQDAPLALTSQANSPYLYNRVFYLFGEQLQVLPAAQVTLSITSNYKPTRLLDLADGDTVDYPDGGHLVLAWEAGARLLRKGGAETDGAADLRQMASEERETVLLDVQRRTIAPVRMMPMDDAGDWGSS